MAFDQIAMHTTLVSLELYEEALLLSARERPSVSAIIVARTTESGPHMTTFPRSSDRADCQYERVATGS